MTVTYKDAGVDIARAESTLGALKAAAKRTPQDNVLGGLGGFGGLYALSGFKDPVLVSGTDGVGTKLLVALEHNSYEGLGQDLVAMCANDILCAGARPLFFLDYFATGSLEPEVLEAVVSSVADACANIGCSLLGGETAELPGLYNKSHFDLAGFCVGVVERDQIVDGSRVKVGDRVLGFASSGVHANGLSLARKVLGEDEALLEPTVLYGNVILGLLDDGVPLAALAHITGGGIVGNLPRALPAGMAARLETDAWPEPEVFERVRRAGPVEDEEMARTFNLGLGFMAVCPADDVETVIKRSEAEGIAAYDVGEIVSGDGEVTFT